MVQQQNHDNHDEINKGELSGKEANRIPAQNLDFKDETQNVNDDEKRPLTKDDDLNLSGNNATKGTNETIGIP